MKHKIIIPVIAMITMLASAFVIYNHAVSLAGWLGISVRSVDTIACGFAVFTLIPSAFISDIRKQQRHE